MIEEFIFKPLSEWVASDLQELVGQAQEDDRLEFKSVMYDGSDDQVREMLRDISALANHRGGCLLIGVEEGDESRVVAIPGIAPQNDEQRIRATCLSNFSPRIIGLEVHSVPVSPTSEVVVVRVPFSYMRPHMITFKGLNQFWKRHGREKARMSIDEIRYSFERQLEGASRLELFLSGRRGRAERLSAGSPAIFLYASPTSFPDEALDMADEKLREVVFTRQTVPDHCVGARQHFDKLRPSLDGLISEDRMVEGRYLAIHRTGHVEHLTCKGWYDAKDGETRIFDSAVAGIAFDFCSLVAEVYRRADRSVPMVVGLDIHSSVGLTFSDWNFTNRALAVWREPLMEIPGQYVENIQSDWNRVARELCDRIWNAFGFERCRHINDDGIFQAKS